MNLFDGVHEWSGSEITAKDEAVSERERVFADDEGIFDLAETSYEMAAINQILAWLDFPYQQRAYLDCLIAIAGGSEQARFNATNIEIARQLRTGKKSRDESLAKWVSRQKRKFQEWQARRQFNLVEITDGWFDAKRQKNTPSAYLLHIVEWAKRAVANAKAVYQTIWRKGIANRRKQLRAIRRAAFDLLQSIPECPPLRLKVRTLSVEDNFDRRAHSVVSFAKKNVGDLHRVGYDHHEFIQYLQYELNKLDEMPPGALGNMLTPKEKDVDIKAKIWQAIQRGTLGELMNPPEIIDYTGLMMDGEAAPVSEFQTGESSSDNAFNKPIETAPDRVEHRTDIESDNCTLPHQSDCNSLNPLSVGRTFLSDDNIQPVAVSTPENQPAIPSADQPLSAEDMELKQVQKVVRLWEAQVRNRIPAPDSSQRNQGAWDIAWQAVTGEAQRTDGALNFAMMKTSYSKISLEKLKPLFVDYVMARLIYWRDNVPVIIDAGQLERFRERLTNYIETPDLNSL